MVTFWAPKTLQVSVAEPPEAIVRGLAKNVIVGNCVIVTVAWLVIVPPGPFAVNVYVVVVVGWTIVEPDSACDPMPLSIVTVVALVVVQIRFELWPEAMALGEAEKEIVGAGVVTVTVAVLVVVPPVPVAVSV